MIIKCPECGKDVSNKAETCPNCGVEVKNKGSTLANPFIVLCLFISCVLVIVMFVAVSQIYSDMVSTPKNPNAWKTEDNKITAYLMMEDWVKDRLKAPSTAKFPRTTDYQSHTTKLEGNKYQIHSYVDAQNSFGAQIRTYFKGTVQQISEDKWSLISLELLE